jgi:hypothetical protein
MFSGQDKTGRFLEERGNRLVWIPNNPAEIGVLKKIEKEKICPEKRKRPSWKT